MTFNEIRKDIECIFDTYRRHKYYTLFMSDIDVSITSKVDTVGGGKSNKTSDKTADIAIKLADEKVKAERFVNVVERAVEQLPDIERKLIELRYMPKNYNYINDYMVYEMELPMHNRTYSKLRERAFNKLYIMLIGIL